jgi:uncharacterized protein (DUF4415 family)
VPRLKATTKFHPDANVLESFRDPGPGWQSHINDALCNAAGLA